MVKIESGETEISGNWNYINGSIEADNTCDRIEKLTSTYLTKISKDESGWDQLYQDKGDKRYWELTYPHSEMHGGGPPRLKNISKVEAHKRYKLRNDNTTHTETSSISLDRLAVFTTKYILEGQSPILNIFHYDDGTWQFSSNQKYLEDKDFRIVSFKEILAFDLSIKDVGELPVGYQATKEKPTDNWAISRIKE